MFRKRQPDLEVEITIRIEGGDDDTSDFAFQVGGKSYVVAKSIAQTKADIDALPEIQKQIVEESRRCLQAAKRQRDTLANLPGVGEGRNQ